MVPAIIIIREHVVESKRGNCRLKESLLHRWDVNVLNSLAPKAAQTKYSAEGLTYFNFVFEKETTLNKVVFVVNGQGGNGTPVKDYALDVKLSNGTWKRVAENLEIYGRILQKRTNIFRTIEKKERIC